MAYAGSWHIDFLRHIQNPVKYLRWWGTLRTFSQNSLFRHFQSYLGNSAIFSHVQGNCLAQLSCIFKTLAYLETETSSKACQTCRMTKHIESPGIAEQFILASSRIFNDIQYFWCIFSHAQALFSLQRAPL